MSRDLFAESVVSRHAPKRSKWVIAGSFVAHVAVLAALIIIPLMSALHQFVVHAQDLVFVSVPAASIPASPPPPRTADTRVLPSDIKLNAAPLTPPENPVTNAVPPPLCFNCAPGVPGGTGPAGGSPIGDLLAGPPPLPTPLPSKPLGPVRPGGDIQAPARTSYVAPVYPVLAKNSHIEGNVILEATIDEAGIVRDVRVLRSTNPLLDRAAIDAVSQWRYSPTRLNGAAVPVLLTVTVTFTLK